MATTITKLFSTGILQSAVELDEISYTSVKVGPSGVYAALFDETNLAAGTAERRTSTGTYLVSGYFDEYTLAQTSALVNGSAQFSGSNYLSVPNNVALNPGTGNFTIEFWVYLNSTTNNASFWRGNNGGVDVFMNGAGRLALGQAQISTLITDTVTMTTGAWVHIAAVKNAGTIRLYKNGVSVGSSGSAPNFVTDTINYIGNQGTFKINGYISNMRVVIGLGVYTSAFTVPTTNFTVTQSANTNGNPSAAITAGQTQLLLNTYNGSGFLTDSSTNAFTVTNNGSVTSSTQAPF